MIFIVVLICGSLIHWHWKSSLISHLSVTYPVRPFSSLEELLSSSYYITTKANGAYQLEFEAADSGPFQKLWQTKFIDKSKSLKETLSDSIQVTLAYKYTTYLDYHSALSLSEYRDCQVNKMNFRARKFQVAFGFPKNFALRPLFNQHLLKLVESGEMAKIITRHSIKPPVCSSSNGMPLGFENISLSYLLLCTGMIIAISTLIVELMLKKIGLFGFWIKF